MDKEAILKGFAKVINKQMKANNMQVAIVTNNAVFRKYDLNKSSCIFIKVTQLTSSHATLEYDDINSIVDIFYYPKLNDVNVVAKLYIIEKLIKKALKRQVVIEEDGEVEFIDVFNIESNITGDNVGNYLHISVDVNYLEQVLDYEEYAIATDFNLNIVEKSYEEDMQDRQDYYDILHIHKKW